MKSAKFAIFLREYDWKMLYGLSYLRRQETVYEGKERDRHMATLELKILKASEQGTEIAAAASGDEEIGLVYTESYTEGDRIVFTCDENGCYVIQLDDAIGASFVYMTGSSMEFPVPFGEKKACYSPKSFGGDRHLLYARSATAEEKAAYRNLCLNRYDVHENGSCYPHASANIETRGESVFAAKNAINGNRENHSHGDWPYESWGINMDVRAEMLVEFGRPVLTDKIRMYTRSDFPHDSWWTQVTLQFSDGSELVWDLEKSDRAHEIAFPQKQIEWVRLCNLIKADDPSPFPALSQFEVYGCENSQN